LLLSEFNVNFLHKSGTTFV